VAIRPQKSLGEVRAEVLKRIGFRATASSASTNNATVDSYIRATVEELALDISFLELKRTVNIELVPEQATYSWPDEAGIGGIIGVWVLDSNGRSWPIEQGTIPHDDPASIPEDAGRPRVIEYVDREIRLSPAPDADWASLELRVELELPPLIDDAELMPFNSELIIRGASAMSADHYGRANAKVLQARYVAMQRSVRGSQQGCVVVSTIGPMNQNPVTPTVGNGAQYTERWKPWYNG